MGARQELYGEARKALDTGRAGARDRESVRHRPPRFWRLPRPGWIPSGPTSAWWGSVPSTRERSGGSWSRSWTHPASRQIRWMSERSSTLQLMPQRTMSERPGCRSWGSRRHMIGSRVTRSWLVSQRRSRPIISWLPRCSDLRCGWHCSSLASSRNQKRSIR